ncbi:hypothetical protein CASFOL_012654 [Castilleja foliolosa]|uniref:Protein NRT1/ PTR FAMILY 5.10-like n=1 Tax=Castilleja foliolosa TaxID=1961234 RepID=A0ABD3DL71_9LAMI
MHDHRDIVSYAKHRSLDRALLAPEEVSRNSEIEESKALIKLLPLWITSLPLALVVAQSSTLFTTQGITMDRSIGSKFDLPAASLQYTMAVTIIIFIPIYDRVFVPLARKITKIPSGITQLQRIETGLFLCTLSIVIAALVERKRLRTASVYGLSDSPEARIPMSFFWLMPQYVIFGISDVFALIGLQEVFYDQMPCGLKAVGLSVYLSIFGIGSFLSSFMIWVIQRVSSEDGQEGWFSDNTNRAHFDYFYWLLGGLNATGFLSFLYCAKSLNVNNGNRVGTIV